jgi:peptidylprolyl isomerase
MKLRWLLVVAVLAVGSGCCSTLKWSDIARIVPRDCPRNTVIRFQLGIAGGNSSDSYESLTQMSQDSIPYLIWKYFMSRQKDPDTGEYLFDIMNLSKVDLCYEANDLPPWMSDCVFEEAAIAQIFYEKTRYTYNVYLFLEGEEWKVGLIETFVPPKVQEYREEHPEKFEKKEGDMSEKKTGKEVGVIQTNFGKIVVEFYPDLAPKTVARIKELVGQGFYDGLIFHRIVPGFCIQGGDPTGTGSGGTGTKIPGEFTDTPFENGSLGMARAQDPNSNDCQFFFTLGRISHLDNQYTLFGRVIEGLDVLRKMEKVPLEGPQGMTKPKEAVRIEKFTLENRASE